MPAGWVTSTKPETHASIASVALKISKEQFTPRFETEARATAALEHPHICRLYDICHEEACPFSSWNTSKARRLRARCRSISVLAYAGQIASALDEAHRKQIVHRDLKPSNVLVTPKGGVKLLDFGLAKLGSNDTPLDDAALTRGITAAGTILGTLHYMSPEQLQGGRGRRALGHLCVRSGVVRDVDREARLRGRIRGQRDRGDSRTARAVGGRRCALVT